jgi:glycosyltransferase involved in cell wall biosynthesis
MHTKIVHLTTVHPPFDVRIFHKEAASLAAAGLEVVVIACADKPAVLKQVRIRPLPAPRGRLERMTRTAYLAYRAACAEDAQLYHFHDPELIGVGLLLKLRGKRVIYDVHEDVSKDIHDKAYLPGWSKPLVRVAVRLFEAIAIRAFDHIVAATSAIERNFPKHRVTLIRNVPFSNELAPAAGLPFAQRSCNVVYVGGLAGFNGVEQMVRAVGEIPAHHNVRLILGGKFPSAAEEQRIRALPGWNAVDYVGWVDRTRIAELFARARAGLVVYQPTPNIMECEPNKFFEVLSAGLPLIASNLPHWRAFIEQHRCGVVVPPGDPREIARAILHLIEHPDEAEEMGARGRRLVLSEYNWSVEHDRLVSLYRRLLGPQSQGEM